MYTRNNYKNFTIVHDALKSLPCFPLDIDHCVKSVPIRNFSGPQGYDQKRGLFHTNSFVLAHSSVKTFYIQNFLVRIFLYSVRIQENTDQKKTPYSDTVSRSWRYDILNYRTNYNKDCWKACILIISFYEISVCYKLRFKTQLIF